MPTPESILRGLHKHIQETGGNLTEDDIPIQHRIQNWMKDVPTLTACSAASAKHLQESNFRRGESLQRMCDEQKHVGLHKSAHVHAL